MKNDYRGLSTTPAGQEDYEYFDVRGSEHVQYDYRTKGGVLFSCVARCLAQARNLRDEWFRERAEERNFLMEQRNAIYEKGLHNG